MIVHNFDPVFIDFGSFQIKWYSLSYIFGIILGWIYANSLIKKYNLKMLTTKIFDDSIIYIILGIILGGRLGYVFFYNFDYFAQNFSEIFKIWQGGMSFHGGLIGIIISILVFSKIKKINFFVLTDIISCVAPVGIFLGRIANFINGELYGKASSVSWAVIFPAGGNISRHPSQIYEAILEGVLLFILINFLAIKKKLLLKTGYISSSFLILYAIFRIFSEYFREADEHLGYFFSYFSMGTLLSIVTLLAGCLIIIFLKKNEQNN
tara:strand:+ start:712 stop:1506 length:795 start_codon:yes stop_codon:yes gene_type:complete